MLSPTHVPPVASDEQLARFIYSSRHIRNSDNTVKADAFIPHPHTELSITRHLEATEEEIWSEGERIAEERKATLHGRADVIAHGFTNQDLSVIPAPIPENPNHANAANWPGDKPAQKIKALEIARQAQLIRR